VAFSAVTARGSAVDIVNDTTIAVSPDANLTVGKLVVVTLATKNIATVDGASSTHSLADTNNHVWNKATEQTETEAGAAGDGSTISVWWTIVTTQIGTGDSITGTTTSATAEKIITIMEATFDTTKTIQVYQVGVGPNAIAATVSSLPSREYFLVGAHAAEGSDAAKTNDADYTEQFDLRSRNNAAAITNHIQTRIATLTTDTCTSTNWTTTQPIATLTAFTEGEREDPPAGALTLTGLAPTLGLAFSIAVGSLAFTGTNVGVAFDGPNTGALTLTGQAPTLSTGGGTSISVDAGGLTLTGYAPGLDFTIPMTNGSLGFTGLAPTLDSAVPVGAGALALTGQSPALDLTIPVAAGSITVSGETPSVQSSVTLEPAAGALTFTGQAPSALSTIPIDAGVLALTGLTPGLVQGQALDIPAGALVFKGPARAGAITRSPDPAALTLTGYAPSLGLTIPVAAGGFSLTGQAPTLDLTVPIAAGALTLTGDAPGLDLTIPVASGVLSLTGTVSTLDQTIDAAR
jgi:hypothetical protein